MRTLKLFGQERPFKMGAEHTKTLRSERRNCCYLRSEHLDRCSHQRKHGACGAMTAMQRERSGHQFRRRIIKGNPRGTMTVHVNEPGRQHKSLTVDDVDVSTSHTQSANRVAPPSPRAARSNMPVSQEHPCIGDVFNTGQ